MVLNLPPERHTAAASGSIYSVYSMRGAPTGLLSTTINRWFNAFFATTLATHLLTTCILAFKIHFVRQAVPGHAQHSTLRYAFRVVLESGAMYSVAVLTTIICFDVQPLAFYIMLDVLSPIISIAFCTFIIRTAGVKRKVGPSPVSAFAFRSGMVSPLPVTPATRTSFVAGRTPYDRSSRSFVVKNYPSIELGVMDCMITQSVQAF